MAILSEKVIHTPNFETFLNRSGDDNSEVILFLHGSGPGVTAHANWRFALDTCGEAYHCLAPDLFGFGKSSHPEDELPKNRAAWMEKWVNQLIELLDEL